MALPGIKIIGIKCLSKLEPHGRGRPGVANERFDGGCFHRLLDPDV